MLALSIPTGQGALLSPVMKIVMQLWRVKPEEIAVNPALQEFVASGFLSLSGTNPAESIQKMLSQFPGIADSVAAFAREAIDTHSVTLRTHAELYMPILAMQAPRAAAGASPAPAAVSRKPRAQRTSAHRPGAKSPSGAERFSPTPASGT